jgi:hypothetical protein
MINLDSSAALAHLLVEDRYPHGTHHSFQADCSNAKSGAASMRVGLRNRTVKPSAA